MAAYGAMSAGRAWHALPGMRALGLPPLAYNDSGTVVGSPIAVHL